MKLLQNLHVIEVSFLPVTENNGARIKLYSPRFKQSKILNYDYIYSTTLEQAQTWLEANDFELMAKAEGKNKYYIMTTTFKPLK